MDEEGMVNNTARKLFTTEQRKQYMKHHKVKEILTNAITHAEFLKIVDKSSAKSIWDSLCSTYEGNKQVREAKANLLV
ncbi:aspartyl-tRNA synthetase, partial [Trifolium medium]|nr:aspartyl-tRNA synthetase [Trifolium medium]